MDDAVRHARLDGWFRAYGDRVLAYLLHRTDRETAQDVLQEVFVTAFRKAPELPEPPIGWLLGTARRQLANATRAAQRRDRLAARVAHHTVIGHQGDHAGGEGGGNAGGDGAAGDAVAHALDQLSERDREVLTLSAWYELSADQAAFALGCSPGAYAVRLHRARRRLAERLRAVDISPRPDPLSEAAHE